MNEIQILSKEFLYSIRKYKYGFFIHIKMKGLYENFCHGCPYSSKKYCIFINSFLMNQYEINKCDFFKVESDYYAYTFDICDLLAIGNIYINNDILLMPPEKCIIYKKEKKLSTHNKAPKKEKSIQKQLALL